MGDKEEMMGSEKLQSIQLWRYLVATIFPVLLLFIATSILTMDRIKYIAETKDQIAGVEIVSGLNRSVTALQKVRGLWQIRLQGGTAFVSDRIEKRQIELESALTDLIDGQNGVRFKIQDQLKILRDDIRQLISEPIDFYSSRDIFEAQTDQVGRLLQLMQLVAIRSGLVLGSSPEIYYLINMIIKDLPEIAESIGEFRGIASGLVAKAAITEADNILMQSLRISLGQQLDNLQRGHYAVYDALLNADKHEDFRLNVEEFVSASLGFMEETMRVFNVQMEKDEAFKFFVKVTRLIDLNTNLHNKLASHLNQHFEQLVSDLYAFIFYMVLIAALVSMLLWYFVAGFYRSNYKAFYSLQESQKRFALAVRGTNDGIWDWDLDSGKVYFSPHWKQMLGYELKDVDNNFIAWRNLIHPDDLGQFLDHWLEYMDSDRDSLVIEYRIRRKTGDYIWVLCRGLLSFDEAGHPARLSGSQTDITGQRLLQKQLQQTQKMRAIGQIIGGIAHDFNNILASVMGYTELARDELMQYGNERLDGYLNKSYKSSERARDLVSQMLAFSHGGKEKLEPIMLLPLINESLTTLRSTLSESIEIDLKADDESLVIMAAPMQLHQLIMNLCANAQDAMQGKGRITIRLEHANNVSAVCRSCHEKVSGDYIQLSVHDTGDGITTEQLERIFDPFYTTKQLSTDKGTGMGLAMVHGIMHDHGGHIVVDTEKGKGAKFSLMFPVSRKLAGE